MHHSLGNLQHPVRRLVLIFVLWKALLLLVACCSPGLGYDTSTSLILFSDRPSNADRLPLVLQSFVSKLMRWDAVYFVQASRRGYTFEQEWAFGWGFTRLIAFFSTNLQKVGVPPYNGLEAVLAVLIAHTSHLISVILLFILTPSVFPGSSSRFAFAASALHILSPGGLFLSAPYAESSCALLSFAGCLAFIRSFAQLGQNTAIDDVLLVTSGALFGAATTFRSNGILNGLLLLEEAIRVFLSLRFEFRLSKVRRLAAAGLGGLLVAVGLILPQYIAYSEYCYEPDVLTLRPWCGKIIPSIYTFVQNQYWNLGFFRYWTLSNLPLFLLAAPMLVTTTASGLWGLNKLPKESQGSEVFPILRNVAISQLLLTMLTLTTAHVQIITRISSAFPVWLWYAATRLQEGDLLAGNFVRFMVIYAVVQGGLFASFLPPA